MEKCPTCGSNVKVVGGETKHYEPIELSKEILIDMEALSLELFNVMRSHEKSSLIQVNHPCLKLSKLCGLYAKAIAANSEKFIKKIDIFMIDRPDKAKCKDGVIISKFN